MLATVALAMAIPVALGGAGSWTLRGQATGIHQQSVPYHDLLSRVDQCIRDIRQELSAQSNPLDWQALLALRPPPPEQPEQKTVPLPQETPVQIPRFNLYLDGIAYKDKEKMHYAYVNGQVLEEGDAIDGFMVRSIEKSRATFVGPDGQIYTIDIDEQLREVHPGYRVP